MADHRPPGSSKTSDGALRSGVVVLAAGEGRRFGAVKQLAPIRGEPMIHRVAHCVLELGLPVVLVTGAHAPQVEAAIADLALHTVHNDAWASGMGGSLARGVARLLEIHPSLERLLLCLGDQPLVDPLYLRALLARHQADPNRIMATAHADACGPPAVFPRDCFESLLACSGARGAQALLRQQHARVEVVRGVDGIDVDTAADLAAVERQLEATPR